ncbi:MAG: T9SS type A sorting domain-containing protein [Chitinophagaceae bacterium]|nr:T9SS type A sorting domain-containing protein [Chitinophagaceae bacterium]
MKKVYALLVVCLSLSASLSAQTYYWIGPSSGVGGNWNSNTNWSFASGGAPIPAGQFPNSTAHNVIFDQPAVVNVNVTSIDLLSLTVTNNTSPRLYIGAGAIDNTVITVHSTSLISPALRINSGSTLEDSTAVNFVFSVNFNVGAKGLVDGTWKFIGAPTVNSASGAGFTVSGGTTRVDINGTVHFRPNTSSAGGLQDNLFFNSGSLYWHDKNGSSIPRATWSTNATMRISNVISALPVINSQSVQEVGNIILDCPGLANPPFSFYGWSLPNTLVVKGNLQIVNTNNKTVVLASNGTGITSNNFSYTVNGNFDISGPSKVAIANASTNIKVVNFQVNGNLNAGGSSLDLQISNNVAANPTTLKVKGNVNHTAGTFGSAGTISSTSVDLYVLELNGTTNQNISSFTGEIDNSTHEISLRMNNPAGATLTSPLSIGKISFNSADKGKVTTTAVNVLTINNTGTHSLVINTPANTGFVNGPVRRRTASTNDYLIPTGKGSTYDPAQIRPATATPSVYQAEYFNTAFADLSVMSPVNAVTNTEYWQIATISGADAALLLTLNSTVPGGTAGEALGIARYNGADWVDYSMGGNTITPGTANSGTLRTALVPGIGGFFTFARGIAGALPIKLLTFDAKKINGTSAQVSWLVSNDSNSELFEVTKSTDGRNFTNIGRVTATALRYNYGFIDNSLGSGTTYYRLKMLDQDGRVTYSPIVAVLNGSRGVLLTSLQPTVVTSGTMLTVSSSEKGTMQLMITDMYGRIVKQQLASIGTGNQQIQLNVQNLSSGAYQVTAVMNNERVGTIRFVKQ